MEPITRDEIFMAAAAGEYDGELPAPITRQEQYLKKIKEAVENGSSVAPEDIDAAIEAYLNSHDADIVTEQELSDELSEYYNKTDIDNALDSKADITDIPDVSGFVTADNLNILLADNQDLSAFSHNCFFRGKNLGTVNASNIDAFITDHGIAAGEFNDIYLGDYFTAPYDGANTVFRIAGFNLYLWSGTESNHIIVLPDYQLTTAAMNSSNTTSEGYYGSAMFNTVLGGSSINSGINQKLYNIFGAHLLAYTDLLSIVVDNNATSKANPVAKGAACEWTGQSVYANLLSGTHLWGENISGSGICDYGIPVGQFPLFRFEPKYIINRNAFGNKNRYWLRNIYMTNVFAACYDNGTTSGKSMDSTVGVRPFFLLG